MSKLFDELSKENAEAFAKVDKEKQKFKYASGPLNKDKATIELEKIFNDLVEDSTKQDKSVKITLENGQLFYQKGTNDKVNLTDILSKANLKHLNIDPALIETYSKIPAIHDNPGNKPILTEAGFKSKINGATPVQKEYLNELTYGECLAIYRYTSPDYAKINGLMREDYQNLKKLGELQEETVKSALMHTIVASSALSKVPDIDLPTVTRRQGDFGIDQMIENVKKNNVTQEKAFTSSSFEDLEEFKLTYPNQIILKNVQGKDISAISYFGKEKEYLISPSTQLKWTGHTMDGENHVFTVEGSNVLLDQRMKKNATSLTTLDQISRKAKEKAYEGIQKPKERVESVESTLKKAAKSVAEKFYEVVDDTKDALIPQERNPRTIYFSRHEKRMMRNQLKKDEDELVSKKVDKDISDHLGSKSLPPLPQTPVQELQKDKSQIQMGEHRVSSRLIDIAHNIEHKLESERLVDHEKHSAEVTLSHKKPGEKSH